MSWSADMTFAYYTRMLARMTSQAEIVTLQEAARALASDHPQYIIRHDIDLSLERALRMAVVEHEVGVVATYHLLPNSPFYSLHTDRSRAIIRTLLEYGHEVGLHYDLPAELRTADTTVQQVEESIRAEAAGMEAVTGRPVGSLSYHRPIQQFLRGPLEVAGRINAYAAELMTEYISDSKGAWRAGEPLALLADPKPVRQVLLHPIWWGEHHRAAADRLEDFYQEQLAENPDADPDTVSDTLAETIPGIMRTNYRKG